MSGRRTVAYKVLTGPEMSLLQQSGQFRGAPIDLADGYIHLSTLAQLTETVDKHFAGQSDLHVVTVDLATLGDAVKWEASRGGQLFPHIYAGLSLANVLAFGPLMRDAEGNVLPPLVN